MIDFIFRFGLAIIIVVSAVSASMAAGWLLNGVDRRFGDRWATGLAFAILAAGLTILAATVRT